jgi:hypothetical protein
MLVVEIWSCPQSLDRLFKCFPDVRSVTYAGWDEHTYANQYNEPTSHPPSRLERFTVKLDTELGSEEDL